MFIFLAKHELLELSQKYPEDIILHINSHIKGARELRTVINQAIESPYGNEDNWDGIWHELTAKRNDCFLGRRRRALGKRCRIYFCT